MRFITQFALLSNDHVKNKQRQDKQQKVSRHSDCLRHFSSLFSKKLTTKLSTFPIISFILKT